MQHRNEEVQMPSQLTFRYMTEADIEQILLIEELSFATPWSRESFENELTLNQYAQYIVLEIDGLVVGYCGMWLILDEGHITNIAVLPEYRGQRLGENILRQVIALAVQKGAKTLTLEVRVGNTVAQNLYRKFGFQDGGIRKNYYTDNQEDALVMWVKL